MPDNSRKGIITAGTWCVDRNKMVEAWPAEDTAAEILAEEAAGGGSGCNLAVDVKRLDSAMPVATIGLVGDDDDGRLLFAAADACGIDRRQLAVTDQAPTHYTDAYASRRSGLRTHVYNQGAAGLLCPDHFDFTQTQARILHLGLPGVHKIMDAPWRSDPNGWVSVLKQAKAAGLITNLELCTLPPARIAALARPCLPHLDLLIVNDVEIGAIAGLPTSTGGRADQALCAAAARAVLALGSMRLVAVHFPMGAIAAPRGGDVVAAASVRVPPDQIRGANGAGDAFAAGFLYAHHEGWSAADALSLAHAAAAASLRSMSTTGSVESWRDCLALAQAWGTRGA